MDKNPLIGFKITIADNTKITIPKPISNARIHLGILNTDIILNHHLVTALNNNGKVCQMIYVRCIFINFVHVFFNINEAMRNGYLSDIKDYIEIAI